MSVCTNSSFWRTASAPASSTARWRAGASSPVRAIRQRLGWSRRMRATAVTPSRRGMCRSTTTASGRSSSTSSIVSKPSFDLGAGRRGVDMGPSAIRYAGLDARIEGLGRRCLDWGNVETAVAEATDEGDERVRFLPQIKSTCERIAELVARAASDSALPLVLGGDHSVALGTLGGLASVHGPGGVLWIDAHGDLNRPETSPSGNVHGMALAAALGLAGELFESGRWA